MKEYIPLIHEALKEIDIFKDKYYDGELSVGLSRAKQALTLLLSEIENKKDYPLNTRVMRAMKDVGTYAVRELEDTKLGEDISKITGKLYYEYPGYRDLPLLRMDFGKWDPI